MQHQGCKKDTGRSRTARLAARLREEDSGVVAVEFALVLPLLLAFILLIIDLSRAFNYINDANQIAANGARFAAVDTNPGGGGQTLQQYLQAQGDTKELRNGGTDQVASGISVAICGSGIVGEPVTVKVTTQFKLTPFQILPLFDEVTLPISGSATMRTERARTKYTPSGSC